MKLSSVLILAVTGAVLAVGGIVVADDKEATCPVSGHKFAITDKTGDRFSGIPCTHKIDCDLIKKLWQEIDRYWSDRNMLAEKSLFS